jgi:hypothetical protein
MLFYCPALLKMMVMMMMGMMMGTVMTTTIIDDAQSVVKLAVDSFWEFFFVHLRFLLQIILVNFCRRPNFVVDRRLFSLPTIE